MKQFDERVDAYIAKSAPFAKEILHHIRKLVHEASPLINETMKWSFPHFVHKQTICSMASFKSHCAFGFWKASLMQDPYQLFGDKQSAMGQMGRIESIKDLPSDEILKEYILEALKLDEAGIKIKKVPTSAKPTIEIPSIFATALDKNLKAKQHFEAFSPSHRREYLEWITEAKAENTKLKRIETAIEWLEEGKSRNWKYQK
jgi:uncharacterized protein YdeI (YjbR/CyaY-like superfamily)